MLWVPVMRLLYLVEGCKLLHLMQLNVLFLLARRFRFDFLILLLMEVDWHTNVSRVVYNNLMYLSTIHQVHFISFIICSLELFMWNFDEVVRGFSESRII